MYQLDLILTYFNGSKYIQDQLQSIENCILASELLVKIIIIDDASSESESSYLINLCSMKPNIQYYRNDENLGVIGSFEKGIKLSTANYLMLSDQDDYWLPNKIAVSFDKIRQIESQGPALIYTDLSIVDDKRNIIHRSMLEYYNNKIIHTPSSILFKNFVTGCTVIFNRELLEFAMPFPKTIVMHDHWLGLCAAFFGKLDCVYEQTILYRQHSSNLLGAKSNSFFIKSANFLKNIKSFNENLASKILQIKALASRLEQHNKENSEFCRDIAFKLERNEISDCVYLLRIGVIKNTWHTFTLRAFFPFLKRL